METRVKIYKKYRDQINKEAELNKRLKYKNKEILNLEKKLDKFDISNDDNLLITNINSIKPKSINDIKKMNDFCYSVPINDISDDFKNIENNKGMMEYIINKDGEINKFFLENNDQFNEIKDVMNTLSKQEQWIDLLHTTLKDNNNIENNWIHEMKSSNSIETFFDMNEVSPEYNKKKSWYKYVFYFFIILLIISFIVTLVLIFI